MTPAQFAERKQALADEMAKAKARIKAALGGYRPDTPEYQALVDANVQIDQLLHRCNVLADGLLPYTDPDFYRELPPSLALDDQGQHARDKLEQAFPE